MKSVLAIAPLALLSACVSFGGKAPASLITLSSAANIPNGTSQTLAGSEAMSIAVPLAPQAIANTRVAVSTGGTAIAYVKNAQWAEPPARLFQRLLAETVGAKTGKTILDPRQFSAATGTQLSGQLRSFGIAVNVDGAKAGEAIVTYDAALSKDRGQHVSTRRFEARVPVGVIGATTVAPALNRAANQVAEQVATWVAGQ